jgi:F0F1-type ATP synthase membrane subunit b/b'
VLQENEFSPLIPYFINFGIVIALLVWMLRAPFRKYVYQRHERMRDAVEAAAIAHRKASDRAEAAKRALATVSAEEKRVLAQDAATVDQEKKDILDKAQAEAHRVGRETERLASAEQDDAGDRVKGQFLDLVVREAEETLKRSLKKEDHSAIIKRANNSIQVGI